MKTWQDWQKPYQFGIIVIWLPDEIRSVVSKQREEYDPVSQTNCEAHITLTQPLRKRLSGQEWDQVGQIIARRESFHLKYGPLNSFLPYPCIWYEIKPSEKILDLHQALHKTGFFNLDLPYTEGFIPHMTITEGLSGPTVDENLLKRLQKESSQGTFLCEELAYIIPEDEFNFRVKRTLPMAAV